MTTVSESLRAALADRYRIERELGRGGMATVYLAHDLRPDRPVAIKVLHPELTASLGPERFLREVHTTARLDHPHILPLLDSGEAAGTLWYTMPYVEGESLRDRLRREGQLPIEHALRITSEVADALDYAHEHKVVHRDIKPENILLARGHARVADFGVARALEAAAGGQLTQTGMAVGTPAYMSPEQASGERTVDGRTDLYALGAVLYEMLAGEPPYTGPTAQAIVAKRFSDPVPSARRIRPSIPEAVDQAVQRALATTPADRFATAAEFARALVGAEGKVATRPSVPTGTSSRRRVSTIVVALGLGFLIGLGVLFAWRRGHSGGEADAGPRRLAVLPFENMGRPEDEYFTDGVTDAIRGKLTALPGLQVIARSSSGQYKKTTKSPQQIGRELAVEYLLTGTVRWERASGGTSRVQVSPELIQASSAAAKWQQPFDAALTDVFQVQAEVAGQVAQALNLALGTTQLQGLADRPTANLEAYDAFLRGDEVSRQVGTIAPGPLQAALPYYQRAVALDSTFALAWTRLARLHSILYNPNLFLPGDSAAAAAAAGKALALAPSLPDTRLALGQYYSEVLSDPRRALEEFAVGRRLAPGDGRFFGPMSLVDQSLGRYEDAVTHGREGLRLDPRSGVMARYLTRALIFVRRYDEALAAADQAMSIDPTSPDNVWIKAAVHIARGDLAAARAVYRAASPPLSRATLVAFMSQFWEMAWTLEPSDLDLLVSLPPGEFGGDRAEWGLCLAQAWALKGDSARARAYADSGRAAYQELLRANPRSDQAYGLLALTLAYLGRYDEAVAAARRGIALRGIDRDQYSGAYNELQLARVYAMANRREQALSELERLLQVPSFLTPGWLRIDPTFAALRSDPRFERLVKGR